MSLIEFHMTGGKAGDAMKNKTLYLLLLAFFALVGCDALPISPPLAEPVAGAQSAWIMLTNPYDGQRLKQDSTVDVRSESGSPNKVKAAVLLVNGRIYRRDEFGAGQTNANIYLPWTPRAPGTYTLQTILEDGTGGQYSSNFVTVYVDVAEEEPTPEITETPSADEEDEEECPQPMATTHSFANCRSGPGTGYDLVVGLKPRESFPLIGRINSGNWWQVERDSGSCWLWSNLIDICGDAQNVKLINIAEKDEVIKEAPEETKPDPTLTPTWNPASGPTGS